ncbi:unnamed protein product, partial [Urochloa humidicola]
HDNIECIEPFEKLHPLLKYEKNDCVAPTTIEDNEKSNGFGAENVTFSLVFLLYKRVNPKKGSIAGCGRAARSSLHIPNLNQAPLNATRASRGRLAVKKGRMMRTSPARI